MMKKKISWLILWLLIPASVSAQIRATTTKYKGEIVDSDTKKPLENVYVILNGTSEGTITNIDGYFEISGPAGVKTDSLRISHLGYSLKMVALRDLSQQTTNRIALDPQAMVLGEVVISAGLSANEILKKVRESLNTNFSQKPFSSELFYRHQMDSDDSIQYIEEAAIDFYDAEGFKRQPKSKISKGKFLQMKQLRRSTSRDSKQYISLWDLPVFWTTDPILSPENLLTESQEKDYILTLVGRQAYGDISVFKIAFSCVKPTVSNTGYGFPSPVVYDGALYVDVDTYAVVKYVANISWKAKLVTDKKFLRRFDVSEPANFVRRAELEFSYKKFSGAYIIHYAKMRDHFKFIHAKTGTWTTRSYIKELLNVRTNLENPKVLSESILSVDPKTVPYDPKFWESFNFISEVRRSGK
jgi:hypothetical protein